MVYYSKPLVCTRIRNALLASHENTRRGYLESDVEARFPVMVIAVSQSSDFEVKELSPIMQTSQVCLFPLASSELDDLESESSKDEEMPKSYRKTLAARIIAWLMCLVTPMRQGETLFQAQKRVFRSRMITRPAVYDESPAWYYTTPWAHASIRS